MNDSNKQEKSQALLPDAWAIEAWIASLHMPIALTAIRPDGKQTEDVSAAPTRWFDVTQAAAAAAWAADQNERGFGVYWTPNVTRPSIGKKPTKKDIIAARFVHVDLDPPEGSPGWTDTDKAAKIDELNELPIPPSIILHSGNGLYPLWRLDGECQNLESIEAINAGAINVLGTGKGTWNIDRLLRVPGTVNYPSELKRRWGRVPIMASIAQTDDGTVHEAHDLSVQFPASPAPAKTERAKVALPGGFNLLTLDGMGLADSFLRKAINHPKGVDRSVDTYHAAAEMVRCGFSDAQVAGILLNPDNPVSAHCLDQPDSERAARRAIEKARTDEGIAEGVMLYIGEWQAMTDALLANRERKHDKVKSANDIVPIDLWQRHEAPALPSGCLPDIIDRFAHTQAQMMGADPAGLALSALAVCAASIDDSIELQVKANDPTWRESARLWIGLVGLPSTKKSPIMRAAMRPLRSIDKRMADANQSALAEWSTIPNKERPAEPTQPRRVVEDATIEALQMVLKDSPHGVLSSQDELSGWFGAMDKYSPGKGGQADRAFWLQAFNGGPYSVFRVARGTTNVPNLSISLLGGIQPEPLRKLANDTVDDGLIQRFIPVVLSPATIGRDEPSDDAAAAYESLIVRLTELLPPVAGNLQIPSPLQFDLEGLKARKELENEHVELVRALETVSPKLAAHFGKHDGMFARLCVIWHCIEYCGQATLPATIDRGTAQRVVRFMREYIRPSAIAFYAGLLGMSAGHEDLMALAGLIVSDKLLEIDARTVQRSRRALRHVDADGARRLCEKLEAFGWLDPIGVAAGKWTKRWAVNPAVHKLFAERGRIEADQRDRARKAFADALAA